jgi:hypothetical protein
LQASLLGFYFQRVNSVTEVVVVVDFGAREQEAVLALLVHEHFTELDPFLSHVLII